MIKKCFSLAAALLAALLLPALFASCLNPAQDKPSVSRDTTYEEDGEYPDYGDPFYEDGDESSDSGENITAISHKSFVIDAVAGLPANDADANAAGKPVAVLTLPEKDGPWTPELVAGVDDNSLFKLLDVSDGAVMKYEVQIETGPALAIGPYTISLNIRNEAGTVFYRVIKFSVAKTPPPFTTAPKVFPYITGIGKNKLVAYWDELPRGAKGFKLYIGTSNNSTAAQLYKTYTVAEVKTNNDSDPTAYINYKATSTGKEPFSKMSAANPSYTTYSAGITDLTWDSTDDGLPNDTTYYIWLKSYNDEGDSAFGPYATRMTTATLPEILWKNVEIATDSRFDQFGSIAKDSDFSEDFYFYCWDSYYGGGGSPTGDCYRISAPGAEHPGGYLVYGSNGSLQGEIVYVSLSYRSGGVKGKWGEPLSGYAANIIFKLKDTSRGLTEDGYLRPDGTEGVKRYMCLNFYGLGTVQSVGPEGGNAMYVGPNKLNPVGRIICYFGNCWDLVYKRNPETDTPEQAIAKFADRDKSLGSGSYIAGIAVPWYRDYWIDRSQPFSEWFK